MASITIRNIEEGVKARLKHRAAEHGCSMEEEARRILRDTLSAERSRDLADLAQALFGPEHGVELPEHPRVDPRPTPEFDNR